MVKLHDKAVVEATATDHESEVVRLNCTSYPVAPDTALQLTVVLLVEVLPLDRFPGEVLIQLDDGVENVPAAKAELVLSQMDLTCQL